MALSSWARAQLRAPASMATCIDALGVYLLAGRSGRSGSGTAYADVSDVVVEPGGDCGPLHSASMVAGDTPRRTASAAQRRRSSMDLIEASASVGKTSGIPRLVALWTSSANVPGAASSARAIATSGWADTCRNECPIVGPRRFRRPPPFCSSRTARRGDRRCDGRKTAAH